MRLALVSRSEVGSLPWAFIENTSDGCPLRRHHSMRWFNQSLTSRHARVTAAWVRGTQQFVSSKVAWRGSSMARVMSTIWTRDTTHTTHACQHSDVGCNHPTLQLHGSGSGHMKVTSVINAPSFLSLGVVAQKQGQEAKQPRQPAPYQYLHSTERCAAAWLSCLLSSPSPSAWLPPCVPGESTTANSNTQA